MPFIEKCQYYLLKRKKCRKMGVEGCRRQKKIEEEKEGLAFSTSNASLILLLTGILKLKKTVMKNGTGHRKMIAWQNIDQLDILVQRIIKLIPKYEYKTKSQIDNASDSVGANFVEGYYSGSIGEYIRFLRYSKRSLAELQERTRRILRKGYINKSLFEKFDDLTIKTMYLLDRLIYSLIKKKRSEDLKRNKKK